MKHIIRILPLLAMLFCCSSLVPCAASFKQAQPSRLILNQERGSITFAVDKVDLPDKPLGWQKPGATLAKQLNRRDLVDSFSDWEPEILANSFAGEQLYDIGEDVVFRMLMDAWCQHRPVELSPDVIWLLICQQFSHYVNRDPEAVRAMLVNHEGKKNLVVESLADLYSGDADWAGIVADFASKIDSYANAGIATTLVADFSTTGPDEHIASQVTLMDVVKPYFDYYVIYAICGIPSITLTGTPEDWRKVQEKTRALEKFGLGWWVSELDPILEEFVKASEGNPDYWFWKDIVKKSRPRTIKGPSCMKRQRSLTKFDGWFLKFFPFDSKGRTPSKVTVMQTMLAETVAVPFTYLIVNDEGKVLDETQLELVAGIVGVQQDTVSYTLIPKIGWFVRTVNPATVTAGACAAGGGSKPQ